MFDDSRSFISRTFLQANLEHEFQAYLDEGRDSEVLTKLQAWHTRAKVTETQAESAFIQTFFEELWGYGQAGRAKTDDHTIAPKFSIKDAGSSGGKGIADLALGWFRGGSEAVPQVLCEFKDIRSDLDTKQNRKGANFTPVEQCLNYVRGARKGMYGNETVQPWWAIVTDMNEFRLYWWDRVPQHIKFTISIKDKDLFAKHDLLSTSDEAQFDRFLFVKLLQRNMLISESGRPALWRMVERQGSREKKIEDEFYDHYKAVRERLFNVLRSHNSDFTGTPTDLLRISQKLLDRFIFAFYCEDMGERMLFPPQFVRDYLKNRSIEAYYDTEGSEIWDFMRKLFGLMNKGGVLGRQQVPEINGGLFADDALINSLFIPNHIFAAHAQGTNDASLLKDKNTLLFLSAYYDYAAKGGAKESLTLYTLGRIFEQSITELEYRVGELEGRDTVAKLTKRKRDGVYYTPEWVVNYLVDETMGPWFATAREQSGENLNLYLAKLRAMKIVDPACGSGAFLISAFRKLLDERSSLAKQMQAMAVKDQSGVGFDESALVSDILKKNIYGVDINPSSVEIAKLALWLHSARAKSPLSSLDGNILCGNSLVAHDCWAMIAKTPENETRINPFDWDKAFDFKFDIVLGNPPYVKLQNMMKVDPDVVNYLRSTRETGTYESAQTGNFDLYLPFIEKGLRLLSERGRMAYIAPSLWTVNDYGAGLRGLIHRTKQLERWLDFKSFQVFEEAITYTALQFFTAEANEVVKVIISPDGEIGETDWVDSNNEVSVEQLPPDSGWVMLSGEERDLLFRLRRDSLRLDDNKVTSGITVGVQTSADNFYHLTKSGSDKYICKPEKNVSFEVAIEDDIMRPLVSGAEAQRYESCVTNTYILFPYYRDTKGNMQLYLESELKNNFPKCLKYLNSIEKKLRGRESNSFDDDQWYRFGRSQNIDKQDLPKIIVPRLVTDLCASFDSKAEFCLDNVDAGGILNASTTNPEFLLGSLNASVCNFVFRRISKPFQNGYWSANKQFIAPLPIPHADKKQQAEIGKRARSLQEKWTMRRDLLAEAEARLGTLTRRKYKPEFLWPDLPDMNALKAAAPKKLLDSQKTSLAHTQFDEELAKRIEALQGYINSGDPLEANFGKGELRLTADGRPVLTQIYLDDAEGQLAEIYWRFLILKKPKVASTFARQLAQLPSPPDSPTARQFTQRVEALIKETKAIAKLENEMNNALYALYKLSPEERNLIEEDCKRQALL
jgi:Eco57I restriction-modification methylase/TaqI-like C-terminal specificity domain